MTINALDCSTTHLPLLCLIHTRVDLCKMKVDERIQGIIYVIYRWVGKSINRVPYIGDTGCVNHVSNALRIKVAHDYPFSKGGDRSWIPTWPLAWRIDRWNVKQNVYWSEGAYHFFLGWEYTLYRQELIWFLCRSNGVPIEKIPSS